MRPLDAALAAFVLAALSTSAIARDGRKIFVSVDMEGIAGVVSNEQLGPPGFEYERFREFMTEETNAAIAGQFGVPVLFISGDDAIVKEARALLGDVEGAVVKWAYGFHSAKTLTPEAARDVIRDRVKAAMARRASFRPYVVKTPVELEVRFKSYRPAEVLSYLPIVKRVDAHSVRFVGKDMLEVSRFMEFMLTYQPSLEP